MGTWAALHFVASGFLAKFTFVSKKEYRTHEKPACNGIVFDWVFLWAGLNRKIEP